MSINRTSWKKGRSGNPRGRPRAGEELGALLRQLVDRKRFAEKLCELCYAGDILRDGLALGRRYGMHLPRRSTRGVTRFTIAVSILMRPRLR